MDHIVVSLFALPVFLASFLGPVQAGGTDPETLHDYKCDKSQAGRTLDLVGATITFDKPFDSNSVTPPSGSGPWLASVQGNFGLAQFLPPGGKVDPYHYSDGLLSIRMSYDGSRWVSGNMQSVNERGQGFAQQYGYFEMRAKLPAGMGNWPAFWLGTTYEYTAKSETQAEIDIFEGYGGRDQHGFHTTVHLWPAPASRRAPDDLIDKHWMTPCYQVILGSGLFDGAFHTFGGEITPAFVIIYYDRKEIVRFKTLQEFKRPLFMRVDLALSPDEKRVDLSSSELVIDYVRVWQRPEWRLQP